MEALRQFNSELGKRMSVSFMSPDTRDGTVETKTKPTSTR